MGGGTSDRSPPALVFHRSYIRERARESMINRGELIISSGSISVIMQIASLVDKSVSLKLP